MQEITAKRGTKCIFFFFKNPNTTSVTHAKVAIYKDYKPFLGVKLLKSGSLHYFSLPDDFLPGYYIMEVHGCVGPVTYRKTIRLRILRERDAKAAPLTGYTGCTG